MNLFVSKTWEDEQRLGSLAMEFRSSRDPGKRRHIADEYAEVVQRLIRNGWNEMPPPEDQLPADWMPRSFDGSWVK
ncbi:MAG: hypothetical protein HY269_07625 [Deltaproteobacteria bacterium]|nr:hypothetical protein [Deltaproteobacteria bacterium]